MSSKKHFLIEKYQCTLSNLRTIEFIKKIESIGKFPLNDDEKLSTTFNWKRIDNTHTISYDIVDFDDNAFKLKLNSTPLAQSSYIYADIDTELPIVRIPAKVFIDNWRPLIDASLGMGCIVVNEDYEFLMEFTGDNEPYYILYSNFPIMF